MSKTLQLVYIFGEGDFDKGMRAMEKPMARAATAAVHDAGYSAKIGGQEAILAGGMSARFARIYTVKFYPRFGDSIDAAAFVYHKTDYAGIFQTGGTVHGKPRLFIPLPGVPKKIGRNRVTPRIYEQRIGPLFPVQRPGKPLLLMAKVASSKARLNRKFTVGSLRSGHANRGHRSLISVPMFVGVDQVTIPKKFDTRPASQRALKMLPSLYQRYLQAD